MGFAGGHVFTYSPRPGTAAHKMKSRVPVQVAKERNKALRKIFADTGYAYRDGFIGTTRDVLWESAEWDQEREWILSGLTDNYIRVYTNADQDLWNQITPVLLKAHYPQRNALMAELVSIKG
jgi:threonylcarbamoyladenosine tRNA methylthiotransferase MtaB